MAQGILPHIPLSRTAGVHYVSTSGVASGGGTASAPWTLAYALSGAGGQIANGETVWIRGGTYSNAATALTTSLAGTGSAPIIFRAYPTERVILDWSFSNNITALTFTSQSSDVWLWDIELRNSAVTDRTPAPIELLVRGNGIDLFGARLKIINSAIHDFSVGVGHWSTCTGCEVYGSLIYYNDNYAGYIQTPNSADTSIYEVWMDNLTFKNQSYSIHAYGSGAAYQRNLRFEGNAFFASGQISTSGQGPTFLLGGTQSATQCSDNFIVSNYLYGAFGVGGGGLSSGYIGACLRTRTFGNYVFDRNPSQYCTSFNAVSTAYANGTVVSGNTFCSTIDDSSNFQSKWPSNTFVTTSASYPTSGTQTFIRPNIYEPGRAHVIVFNWDNTTSVSVSLASANFRSGDAYAIYDAQDYFVSAVASGTYNGSSVSIPMTNTSVSTPAATVGAAPTNTAPQFGAFVVKKTNS